MTPSATVSTVRTVSILGGSGYSGAELLGLLLRHPHVRVARVFANASAGKRVDALYPRFRGRTDLVFDEYAPEKIAGDDLVFLALPSGEAMRHVPGLLEAGVRVIDLGGDYRLLDAELYKTYYKHDHASPALLGTAVYGLTEWNREAVRTARLLANPGCYVTSALLPLLPLLRDGLIDPAGIVISSQSGVSGAGRSSSVDLSFSEVNESVKAYKVGVHQHTPEIETYLRVFAGPTATITFAPHLIPITRGIYSSIYAVPKSGITEEQVRASFERAYAGEPFIRLTGGTPPEIKHVQYTNMCDIGWHHDARNNRLVLLSVIDNLVKGAAGQALHNMNLMFGFNETEGLV